MKKQTVLSIVLFLLVSNYLSFQVGQTLQFYGEAPAATKTSPAVAGRGYGINQVLTFSATRVDFGVVAANQPQRRTISFQNKGSQTVTIVDAKASCHCTSVQLGNATLAPGQRGELELLFNPALSQIGSFSISVSIQYQDRPQVDRLLVTGEVVATKSP